jgi:hypothetical protein
MTMPSIRRRSLLIAVVTVGVATACTARTQTLSTYGQSTARASGGTTTSPVAHPVGVPGRSLGVASGVAVIPLADTAYSPFQLPQGYAMAGLIAGDELGSGVWVWAESSTESRVFHYEVAPAGMSSYLMGPSSEWAASAESALIAAPDGTVWLGVGMELGRIDRGGTVSTWRVPVTSHDPKLASFQPPEMATVQGIRDLAICSCGKVAIALRNSTAVEVFDPKSQSFSVVGLPTDVAPRSVAYFGDGTLAVAADDYRTHRSDAVIVVTPSGTLRRVEVPDASHVRPSRGGALIVGDELPVTLLPDNTTQSAMLANDANRFVLSRSGVATLPDGRLVADGGDRLVVSDLIAGKDVDLVLGQRVCNSRPPYPGTASSSATESPGSGTALCADRVDVYAVDAGGGVWYESNGHLGQLWRVVPGLG